MAICHEMEEGDLFYCPLCGLELKVVRTCSCSEGGSGACSVPQTCCGKEMENRA